MKKDDYSWVIPGDVYPVKTAKFKEWEVRELHLNEAVEIAREVLKRCLLKPKTSREPMIEDLFALFSIVVNLTQKSYCFPNLKKYYGYTESLEYEEKEILSNEINVINE